MPGRTIPARNAVGRDPAGCGELAPGIERAIRPNCQGEDTREVTTRYPAAQRMPLSAVPTGDAVGCDPAGCGEPAPGIERPVRPNRQSKDKRRISVYPAAQRMPLRAIPTGDAIDRYPAGCTKVASGIERAIRGNRQRIDIAVIHPGAERMPLGTVPAGDVAGYNPAGCGERSPGIDRAIRCNYQGADASIHPWLMIARGPVLVTGHNRRAGRCWRGR